MLVAKNLTKKYGRSVILDNISLSVGEGDVVAVIGKNGCGKSTLLAALAGELELDSGYIDGSTGIAYLPQNPEFKGATVLEFMQTHLKDQAQSHMIDEALAIVGLNTLDKTLLCDKLSGGQKTRLYLASAFASGSAPKYLLLDEPTNNLDVKALEWLEEFVLNFRGGIVLVSHDRYFLDRVATKTVLLEAGKALSYGGSYSFYREQRLIEQAAHARAYKDQEKRIEQMEAGIDALKRESSKFEAKFSSRQPYEKKKASKTVRGAIVKQKMLAKALKSEEHLEKPVLRKSYSMDLAGDVPGGKLVLKVDGLTKTYDTNTIFGGVSFELRGPQRLWLKGSNGSGKTTLLKILMSKDSATAGSFSFGVGIKYGYLSQDSSDLFENNTGILELSSTGMPLTECFRLATHFHLTEDDLRLKVKNLSMGQKMKLGFVKLLLKENHLLLLDEPTNHLEIETREEIESALQEYKGAVLVASHDRYFVESLGINQEVDMDLLSGKI